MASRKREPRLQTYSLPGTRFEPRTVAFIVRYTVYSQIGNSFHKLVGYTRTLHNLLNKILPIESIFKMIHTMIPVIKPTEHYTEM